MELENELRRELSAGERILWSAQPLSRRLKGGFGIWVFGVPWTLFSLFWVGMTLMPWFMADKAPDGMKWTFGIVMPIFGLPFILVGFAMLWSPIKAMRLTRQTVYGLTNLRLIRLVTGKNREVATVLLDQIGPMDRSEARDGTGHLRIQTHSRIDSDGDRITQKFEVLGVPDVARLERLVLENSARA